MAEFQADSSFIGHCHYCGIFCRDGTVEANKLRKGKGGKMYIGC